MDGDTKLDAIIVMVDGRTKRRVLKKRQQKRKKKK